MEFFKTFWDEFGYSFITLAVIGVVIASIIEITVKKLFDTLVIKCSEDGKKEKLVSKKAVVSTICAVVLSTFFGIICTCAMPFPAGQCLVPCWVFIVYIVQYLFSLYVFPKIENALKNAGTKEKKPKVKIVKAVKNDDGTLVEM